MTTVGAAAGRGPLSVDGIEEALERCGVTGAALDRYLLLPARADAGWLERPRAAFEAGAARGRPERLPRETGTPLVAGVPARGCDLGAGERFFRAVLRSPGRELSMEGGGCQVADESFVSAHGKAIGRIHLASQIEGHAAVRRFRAAPLSAGDRDNRHPCERRDHPGYHAPCQVVPAGNDVEAVYRGQVRRSAASVVVTLIV